MQGRKGGEVLRDSEVAVSGLRPSVLTFPEEVPEV